MHELGIQGRIVPARGGVIVWPRAELPATLDAEASLLLLDQDNKNDLSASDTGAAGDA